MDRFFQIVMVGPPEHEMLEAYTALAFAAAATERVTLDVFSGGRAILGIGAAWFEEEHRGLGIAYPPLSERLERLDETLQIAHRMFAGDETPFGRHAGGDRGSTTRS
jgi:alkanesulfonate monooxygenase SsuD/methylene tetrahydromethanopterin reductase-like flavin-dependent oxidoreductase (luciferase family)